MSGSFSIPSIEKVKDLALQSTLKTGKENITHEFDKHWLALLITNATDKTQYKNTILGKMFSLRRNKAFQVLVHVCLSASVHVCSHDGIILKPVNKLPLSV